LEYFQKTEQQRERTKSQNHIATSAVAIMTSASSQALLKAIAKAT
jgi:hypothetical protein